MSALADLGAELSALAQNRPAVCGLVAVGTSLMAGLLLTCVEQLIRLVWRRKTPDAKEAGGGTRQGRIACLGHDRAGPRNGNQATVGGSC